MGGFAGLCSIWTFLAVSAPAWKPLCVMRETEDVRTALGEWVRADGILRLCGLALYTLCPQLKDTQWYS